MRKSDENPGMLLRVNARYTHARKRVYTRACKLDLPRLHCTRVETATLHGLSLALVSRQNFLGFLQTRELESGTQEGGEKGADESGVNGIFARGKYAG